MNKRNKIIGIALILVLIIVGISVFFITRNTSKDQVKELSNLFDKSYEIVNMTTDKNTTSIEIKGDLDKRDSIILAKRINKKLDSQNIKISYFKDNISKDFNGFYSTGIVSQVDIDKNTRKIYFNEFKEDKLPEKDNSISINKLSYDNAINNNGVAEITVKSDELTDKNFHTELNLLSKIIKSENSNLTNVIINSKIGDYTYGVSDSNPDIIRIAETITY